MTTQATRRDLELPALLEVIAELASTDLGRSLIVAMCPAVSRHELESFRSLYDEIRSLVEESRLVQELEEDLAPVLVALSEGKTSLGGRDLIHLRLLLDAASELRRRLAESESATPLFQARVDALPDLESFRQRIASSLDVRGAVRDDATPRLTSLRRAIRHDRDVLNERLGELVSNRRELLSEDTVAQRDGRLMVMLKAGSKGREDGLIHGRSSSGQSFYFEPLETVEANNALQKALADEDEERARILRELLEIARRELPSLLETAELVGDVDQMQALSRFADLTEGRQIEIAEEGGIVLRSARHPLLDPSLVGLREQALGQAGHRGAVVPLELVLEPPQRGLVITGPNAGGKTVAMKTLGLLAVAAHCGIPVPVAEGSKIPFLVRVVAAIGDEQDLLEDRSTFSGRLLRLREAWEEAGNRTLVLLDELGSGTDPEEGAALAIASLEGLLDRGCLVVVTTHLTRLAAAALALETAGCAAMEFDTAGGRPTYRLAFGAPGGSEALSLARRLHLPEELIAAAESRLEREHRDYRRLLREVEERRDELALEQDRLSSDRKDAAELQKRLQAEHAALDREKELVGKRMREDLETFRRETQERIAGEVDRIRDELEAGRRRNVSAPVVQRLFEQAPAPPSSEKSEEEPVVGGRVRHRALGWIGQLEKVNRGRAEVVVKGKRLRCRVEDLVAEEQVPTPKKKIRRPASPEGLGLDAVQAEIHLLGKRVEEALEALDLYLDRALLGSFDEVRVVHGHGTGRLKKAVRNYLAKHPAVASSRSGGQGEGGDGVTVARLRSG